MYGFHKGKFFKETVVIVSVVADCSHSERRIPHGST